MTSLLAHAPFLTVWASRNLPVPSSGSFWTSLYFALYSNWLHVFLLNHSCLVWVLSSWILDSMCTGGLWEGHSKRREQHEQIQGSRKTRGLFGKHWGAQSYWRRFCRRKEGSMAVKIGWEMMGKDLNTSQEVWASLLWRQYGITEDTVFCYFTQH